MQATLVSIRLTLDECDNHASSQHYGILKMGLKPNRVSCGVRLLGANRVSIP